MPEDVLSTYKQQEKEMTYKTEKLKNPIAPNLPQAAANMKGVVLVVDDFLLTRLALKQSLNPAGYTVIEVENGSEALDVLKSHAIDLVIVDIKIADSDSVALQRICFNAKTANIPVIMCTTSTEIHHIAPLGIQGLLMKPIRADAVRKMVAQALNTTTVESL